MIIGSLKALKGLFSLEVGPCFKGIYKGVCVRVPGSIKGSIRVQGLSSFGSFTGSLSCGFVLFLASDPVVSGTPTQRGWACGFWDAKY